MSQLQSRRNGDTWHIYECVVRGLCCSGLRIHCPTKKMTFLLQTPPQNKGLQWHQDPDRIPSYFWATCLASVGLLNRMINLHFPPSNICSNFSSSRYSPACISLMVTSSGSEEQPKCPITYTAGTSHASQNIKDPAKISCNLPSTGVYFHYNIKMKSSR